MAAGKPTENMGAKYQKSEVGSRRSPWLNFPGGTLFNWVKRSEAGVRGQRSEDGGRSGQSCFDDIEAQVSRQGAKPLRRTGIRSHISDVGDQKSEDRGNGPLPAQRYEAPPHWDSDAPRLWRLSSPCSESTSISL